MLIIGAILFTTALIVITKSNKLAANYRQEDDGSGYFSLGFFLLLIAILCIGYSLIN